MRVSNRIASGMLIAGLCSSAAMAQASAWEWSAGPTYLRLRPTYGSDQNLGGAFVGAQYDLDSRWAAEGCFALQTGKEDTSVDLRRWGFLAGPKYRVPFGGRVLGFAHLLAGWEQLKAERGGDSDLKTTFVLGPGLGAEVSLSSRWALRLQGDLLFTHYAGESQRSPSFTLGAVFR